MNEKNVTTIINDIRNNNPLIHNITNEVVMNFTANGLLAFGCSPIMSKEFEDVQSIATIADGILINIGTALQTEIESMIIAGKVANEREIPVVLDPVGVAATPFREKLVNKLLREISFTAIKGNAGEMAHLVNIPLETKGVESNDYHIEQLTSIAKKVSEKYNTVAVVTGEIDVICFKNNIRTNKTGHHYLTKITGAGCLLGSILTACLTTTNQLSIIDKAHCAVSFYGQAAEKAIQYNSVRGTGTFLAHFIDELANDI